MGCIRIESFPKPLFIAPSVSSPLLVLSQLTSESDDRSLGEAAPTSPGPGDLKAAMTSHDSTRAGHSEKDSDGWAGDYCQGPLASEGRIILVT